MVKLVIDTDAALPAMIVREPDGSAILPSHSMLAAAISSVLALHLVLDSEIDQTVVGERCSCNYCVQAKTFLDLINVQFEKEQIKAGFNPTGNESTTRSH